MDISPTQSDVQTALGQFLTSVMPAGVDIVVALGNRVPEPKTESFVVMTPLRFTRLATNLEQFADVKFIGAINDAVMTVSGVDFGTIVVGRPLYGVGIAAGSKIIAQISGMPGGVGTYSVSPAQTLDDRVLAAGSLVLTIAAEATVQLDFHAADTTASDLAEIVATTFRDEYATRFFGALPAPLDKISPFYADDPRLMPFVNDQSQYEWRWVVDARMQVNQQVVVSQQFADQVKVGLIEIDEYFPP